MPASKLVIFFGFCFFVFNDLNAQTNFLPGYYITLSEDTVKGLIEYRSASRNSKVCNYRKTMDSPSLLYSAKDIRGYCVENKFYYRSFRYKKHGKESESFYRIEIEGPVGLMSSGNKKYFAKGPDNAVYEIKPEGKYENVNTGGLGILRYLMKDCQSMYDQRLNFDYKTGNYRTILIDYYNCVDKRYVSYRKFKIKPTITPSIEGSLTFSKISFGKSPLSISDFPIQMILNAGASVSVFLPRVDERYRIVLEALLGINNAYDYFSTGDNTNNDLTIRYTYIRTPLMIRFTGKHFSLEGGLQAQFILMQESEWRQEQIIDNTVFTENISIKSLDPLNIGFIGGIGKNIPLTRNLSVYPALRYSWLPSISKVNYQSSFTYLELSIELKF